LGGLIAKALVGTFLGVLIGYGFIAPLASALDSRRQTFLKVLLSVKVVLLSSVIEMAPAIGVELARKVLYSAYRPNSKELEEILKEVKNTGATEAHAAQ
jgi:chemotaxis protein MotA